MQITKDCQALLALVKAGLWETEVRLAPFEDVSYSSLYELASEQSVVGLVSAGLEHIVDNKLPQKWALQFAGQTMKLEQRNKAMNAFVAQLIEKLRAANVYALLVKGQGIAQCYERPLWRVSGDVDLFLSEENYNKAARILTPSASSLEDERAYYQHLAMTIDGWLVELHGTMRGGLWKGIDRELDHVQNAVFGGGKVRSWMNDKTQVFLPGVDEDVVFVFAHILQHFFKEGIGLRQICDWCRLLWTFRGKIDGGLLESRIRKMGVLTEWRSFASLAVNTLGMPIEAMPLYSPEVKWKNKAEAILGFVFETGNMGHKRDYSYINNHSFVTYKVISMCRHIQDAFQYISIFPLDTVKVTARRLGTGFWVAIRGKSHE